MLCPACRMENIDGVDSCCECNTSLVNTGRDVEGRDGSEGHDDSGFMSQPMGDLIPRDPVKVGVDTPVREVIKRLVDTGCNCALVVSGDQEAHIVGIFTERDALERVFPDRDGMLNRPVGDVMTHNPERLRPENPVAWGLNRMLVGDYRHVPIEAEDGHALGVVSVRHILAYLVDQPVSVRSSTTSSGVATSA